MTTRRRLLSCVAAFGASTLYPFRTWASNTKLPSTIRLVVPFPPGGGGDTLARAVVPEFEAALGSKLWVDNRPGAGGSIGTEVVVKSPADATTIGYVTNGIMCVNKPLYGNLTYDPITALKPIGQISRIGAVMVFNPQALPGINTLSDFIAYARQHPGRINFASAGNGTTSHLAGLFLAELTKTRFTHIPYRGGAAALMDVLAGRIPFMIDVAPNVLPHVESGHLKALAVTTPTRLPAAPSIPTFAEAGVKGLELFAWDGLAVPVSTPDTLVDRLNEALQTALNDPQVKARLAAKGAQAVPGSPAAFRAFIKEENPKWAHLVNTINAAAS